MLLAVLETVRIVAVMLSPITPALAQRVYLQLGISEAEAGSLRWEHAQWGGKSCVHVLRCCAPALLSACQTCNCGLPVNVLYLQGLKKDSLLPSQPLSSSV